MVNVLLCCQSQGEYLSCLSSQLMVTLLSGGVWRSRVISTSGWSETEMCSVRDQMVAELTVSDSFSF